MDIMNAAPASAAYDLTRFNEPYIILDDLVARRLMDYIWAAMDRCPARSRVEFRIPAFVSTAWQEDGYAVLSAGKIAATYGVTRSTVRGAIKNQVRAGTIKVIGSTPDGRTMYAPCLEIGDAFRAQMEAQNGGR